jgi:hypothetical protein
MNSMANSVSARLNIPDSGVRREDAELLTIHRYLPIAAFYFFFNCAGLPVGYFYTSLLSPLIFVWLYLKGNRWLTTKFLLVLSPFFVAHALLGISSPLEYLRTLLHWWTVYIAVYALCWALMRCPNLERLFEELILLNFCAVTLGILLFPTPLRVLFWKDTGETIVGTAHLLRLNLLNTEPSAYAELMLPLLLFAAIRALRDSKLRSTMYLAMIAVPFLLAQSFGGISIGLAGIGIALMTGYRRILRHPKSLIVFLCLATATGVVLLIPNPISARVLQVLAGNDSSTNVRTFLSYLAAYTVASAKSLWWGVGLGQAKFVDFSDVVGGMQGMIPNVLSDIFAEFGFMGVMACITAEWYLFFKTKVHLNSFRSAMFAVAFINQFAGSYGTDVQQYVIWFLAFYPCFPDLDLRGEEPQS